MDRSTFNASNRSYMSPDMDPPGEGEVLTIRDVREVSKTARDSGKSWKALQVWWMDIDLGFETGQESAPVLLDVLQKLNKPNVGVNFDPANMILYDKGNPIEALRLLGQSVRQVHIKDALRTTVPGTWGQEVQVGTGQVDWRAFLATLNELNFDGDLVIEREAGNQRVADIRFARQRLESISI